VLFEARDSALLKIQITGQRRETLQREGDARERTVQIGGHEVSLLWAPGNRVRSFHAVDGKYHLVTTSQTLVKRFFEAGRGRESLGESKDFRWARSIRPLSTAHTAFVYLSDSFLRRTVGPDRRIEITRRVRAAAEIKMVRLAQWAARAEGNPAETVEQLVGRDLLPEGFGRRPDGSHVVVADGKVTDSLRGAYGSFLPVPDVEVGRATPSEVKSYHESYRQRASLWRRMGPVVLGITQRALDGGSKQRVTFDVRVTPYDRHRYNDIFFLVPDAADKQRWANVPGDVASIQVNLLGEKYGGGIRDSAPEYLIENGRVRYPNRRKGRGISSTTPFYAVGRNGALDRLFLAPKTPLQPDEDGDLKVDFILDGWLRRLGDFDLAASNKQTLAAVGPHVKLVDAERPANARLWIADWHECKLAAVSNAQAYVHARKISAGNVGLMHVLTQQLHVPAGQSKAVAEELLDAELVCPLGGRYELKPGKAPFDHWHSTVWQHQSRYRETHVPIDFRAATLDWFAGLSVEIDLGKTGLSTHMELDVRPKQLHGPSAGGPDQ